MTSQIQNIFVARLPKEGLRHQYHGTQLKIHVVIKQSKNQLSLEVIFLEMLNSFFLKMKENLPRDV